MQTKLRDSLSFLLNVMQLSYKQQKKKCKMRLFCLENKAFCSCPKLIVKEQIALKLQFSINNYSAKNLPSSTGNTAQQAPDSLAHSPGTSPEVDGVLPLVSFSR